MDEQSLRKKILPLAKELRLEMVVLFGSTAKGTARPESDVDLAVLAPKDGDLNQITYRLMRGLEKEDLDVSDLRTASATLQFAIAKDGKPILEMFPGQFAQFCSLAARKYYDAKKFRDARRELLDRYARKT